MDQLVFLDTETTGNEFFKDRLCQVAYSHKGKIVAQYFKPPLPISIKAMSITHITNKMVEDKPSFKESKMKQDLEKLLKDNILVAHSAQFDIAMLDLEGVAVPRFICTYKVARFLDGSGEIPEYNLQYLRYYFGLEVEAFSHDAKSDVIVLEALFKKLFSMMMETYGSEEAVLEKMMEVSGKPFLIKLFNFGKYNGRAFEEILVVDKGYLEWMLAQKVQDAKDKDEDLIYTLKYHLKVT